MQIINFGRKGLNTANFGKNQKSFPKLKKKTKEDVMRVNFAQKQLVTQYFNNSKRFLSSIKRF